MPRSVTTMDKIEWSGRIVAIQPRIRLMRSFDERYHSYLGFVLRIDGTCGRPAGGTGKAEGLPVFSAAMNLS